MLSFFLRRRLRRLITYTLIFGFAFLLAGFRESQQYLWQAVVTGFEYALSANGGDATFEALRFFVLSSLAPFLIALSIGALAAFTVAFVIVSLALTIIPIRFQAYLDGVAGMVGLIMLSEAIGLSQPVREIFGSVGTVVFYWAIMFSTSAVVWSRLPFGFRYENTASRNVPIELENVADRLIPGRAPDKDLADISMFNRPPTDGESTVHTRLEPHQTDGRVTFELYQEGTGRFVKSQNMRYELVEVAPSQTSITITVTLTGLSPMSYWDFWNRPFTEDFADHIAARLTQKKDHSTYGRMQSAVRRKQDKKLLSQAPA